MLSVEKEPTFQSSMSPPFSGLKSNSSKKQHDAGRKLADGSDKIELSTATSVRIVYGFVTSVDFPYAIILIKLFLLSVGC